MTKPVRLEPEALIAESPQVFSLVPGVPAHLGARRCVLKKFPYLLIFLELPQAISVVAVAHGARRPGYWRSRL